MSYKVFKNGFFEYVNKESNVRGICIIASYDRNNAFVEYCLIRDVIDLENFQEDSEPITIEKEFFYPNIPSAIETWIGITEKKQN